jgi:hypothetical protein
MNGADGGPFAMVIVGATSIAAKKPSFESVIMDIFVSPIPG